MNQEFRLLDFRMLFLGAAMAEQLAPRVATIINEELGHPASDMDSFAQLTLHYRILP